MVQKDTEPVDISRTIILHSSVLALLKNQKCVAIPMSAMGATKWCAPNGTVFNLMDPDEMSDGKKYYTGAYMLEFLDHLRDVMNKQPRDYDGPGNGYRKIAEAKPEKKH